MFTITNDNFEEALRGLDHFQHNQKIRFFINDKIIDYVDSERYLTCISGPNTRIFYELDLDPEKFCMQFYTKPRHSGLWPETDCQHDLVEVVYALFKVCEARKRPVKTLSLVNCIDFVLEDLLKE